MRSRRDGFTLIELLIVVVIIGILAAIAIPKFASSKEQAYLSTMKSDLRNLATAQESYQYENQAYYGGAIPSASLFYVASTGVAVALSGVTPSGWQGTASHTQGNNILDTPISPYFCIFWDVKCYIIGVSERLGAGVHSRLRASSP